MTADLQAPGLATGPHTSPRAAPSAFRQLMRGMSLSLGDGGPERVELLLDEALPAALYPTRGGQALALEIPCGSLEAAPAGLRDALATTLARLCCLTSVHSDLGLALDADGRVRVLGQRPLDGLEPADGLQWIGEAVETARQLRDLVALQAGEPPLPSQGNHDAPR